MTDAASFELKFWPSTALIPTVRRFVTDFYEGITEDRETVSKFALVTHELLENAVKYATVDWTTLKVSITSASPVRGQITTENQASSENIARIRKKLSTIGKVTDREAFYKREIEEAVDLGGPGGLGLARIFVEADMTLTVKETPDGRVILTAST